MAPRKGSKPATSGPSARLGPFGPLAAAEPGGNDGSRPGLIADRIVDAILAGRLAPGQRLGEQALADLFGVSRTLVREAMARLSARGMVEVNARRGWFVVQPSLDEAREAFGARVAIETGLLHGLAMPLPAPTLQRLKAHVADERAAIRDGDAGERSWLLGDFHVCMADCLGNPLLADILKDLTARTTLIATLYQGTHAASTSCAEHAQIVAALEAGDLPLAIERLTRHIGSVADHLGQSATADDPLAPLRAALTPLKAQADARGHTPPSAASSTAASTPRRRARKPFTDLLACDTVATSTTRPAGASAIRPTNGPTTRPASKSPRKSPT